MVHNLPPDHIYLGIVNDFIGAWDSIAANPDPHIGRGNFMFARQAMALLELAARLYHNNMEMHGEFSKELHHIEPKYFTLLPSPCPENRGFILPYIDDTKKDWTMLWALFDLVRHGLAHQYQQIVVRLKDQKHFFISLSGPDIDSYLSKSVESRPLHLTSAFDGDGDLGLRLSPDILFLDIKKAVENSALLNKGSFDYLCRPSHQKEKVKQKPKKPKYYDFDTKSLEECLKEGGHIQTN